MTLPSSYSELECFSWLSRLLEEGAFDVVVPVERKATALIRALLDLTPEIGCRWRWDSVLSSDALAYLPRNWLKGRRILVFNEMVHHGNSTKAAIDAIEQNTPGECKHMETAAFFVHEDFERHSVWRTQHLVGGPGAQLPTHAIRRSVSEDLYAFLRECLIDTLRAKGALLLDTEHLESSFTSTLPHRRLVDSLQSFGMPIEYPEDETGTYPGMTISAPVVPSMDDLRNQLPSGTNLDTEEPKKIRMVRRGPKEFVFIPIWYPRLPVEAVSQTRRWDNAPAYVKPALDQCPPERLPELAFHLASLLTGVELTRSIWAGLSALVHKGIEPNTPSGAEAAGSPLGHLRALYPLLDFAELEKVFACAVSSHKDKALSARVHKCARAQLPSGYEPEVVNTSTRQEGCVVLLTKIVRDRKKYTVGDDWFDDLVEEPYRPQFPALPWRDFWSAGEQLGISESVRSVIMDTAIDNALLKTAHTTILHGSQRFLVRAFEPDSEFALEALERLAHGAEEIVAHG